MLTIRLQRTGKRNQADFRIVLAEKQAPVKKKIVEVLGSYNPRSKNFKVREERVKYWINKRVEISPTVHNLFLTKSLIEGKKVKAFNIPKKKAEIQSEAKPETKLEEPKVVIQVPKENQPAEASAPKPVAAEEKSAETAAVAEIPMTSEVSPSEKSE